MRSAQRFKVTLDLVTPFFMGHVLTLDGLLSAAIYKKTEKYGADAIPMIPLEMEEGIFKGSSMFCHPLYRHQSLGRVMALRGRNDLDVSIFSPNGRGGKNYTYIDQKRNEYKATITEYPGIFSKEVYFWGVGDMKSVEFLLSNFIIGIGKRSNAGAGEIAQVHVEEIDDDYSWITRNGHPARPLPIELWKKLRGTERPSIPAAVTVPYHNGIEVDAVFPQKRVI